MRSELPPSVVAPALPASLAAYCEGPSPEAFSRVSCTMARFCGSAATTALGALVTFQPCGRVIWN